MPRKKKEIVNLDEGRVFRSHRVKRFVAEPLALQYMFEEGSKHEVIRGIPKDAKLVGAGYDVASNRFYLWMEHDSFPAEEEGRLLSSTPIVVRDLNHGKEQTND